MDTAKKGKPVTTSVPSISIKFHANVEQIEELRFSDDETPTTEEKNHQFGNLPSNDQDSSPLKLFPKVVKRSTSVDVSTNQTLSSSPPSDPWRFFSDIKGKITKSVEEKITEIKARHEEGSPLHKSKIDQPKVKEKDGNKESSSFSDSEDQSESSISRTCGFASTTEGVEMSSDDETSSVDKEKSPQSSDTLRQKFRFFKHHSDKNTSKEGTVNINSLSKIYNINTENVEQALPEDVSEDVESAVDALEETDFKRSSPEKNDKRPESEEIIKKVAQKFANIDVDKDNVINIRQVSGDEVRKRFLAADTSMSTVFAPTGFVDVRAPNRGPPSDTNILNYVLLSVYIVAYAILHAYMPYLAGFLLGASLTLILAIIYMKLYSRPLGIEPVDDSALNSRIMEVPAVKEYQPLTKYEGWVNEYPDAYDPLSYHISHTQSVFLRLQGNLLRISHSKSKVPKRAMWNEPEIKASFVHHRVYNLLNAKITLLPEGLAKIRLWSKKYPICIMLSKDQMNFDPTTVKLDFEDEAEEKAADKPVKSPKAKKKFTFKKREYPYMSQRFSKLAEDQDVDLDSDSRASTPSPETAETTQQDNSILLQEPEEKLDDDEMYSCPDDSSECSQNGTHAQTKIYIFGRTDREKEDWFRRLVAATHQDAGNAAEVAGYGDVNSVKMEPEYLKYMSIFNKGCRKSSKQDCEVLEKNSIEDPDESKPDVQLWFNALIGRVLFDCIRDASFTKKVQNRIQKKLQTIKLPYFIEEILITELNLGKTPPLILKSEKPSLDNRGLWVDLDMSYEGSVVLTLQTKLNLMKLKNPQANDKLGLELKLAIYHSDVDDSAESSTDEEGLQELPVNREGTGERAPVYEKKKKFIKMVDRIAESKIFQAAAENRYIKKAMEGVSNTELRLTVELKALSGTVVLNIPPPPTDRVWVGFRPAPKLILTACPIVGERNFNNTMVTSWIEKKIVQEFEKVMVIPNMEDFLVPVMTPKLPE